MSIYNYIVNEMVNWEHFQSCFYNYIMNIEKCIGEQRLKIYNYIVNKKIIVHRNLQLYRE